MADLDHHPSLGPPLRVAAYGRVSTSNQLREHDGSIDTQLRRIRRRVAYESSQAIKPGDRPWELADVFREEGRSGKDTDRPELQRLLSAVREGRVDAVVVTKIDRITRSLVDFYTLWSTFEEHDVEFIALDDRFDTTTALGRAVLKVTLVFAELERERTAERTKEKLQERRRAGLWFGGVVPLGYAPHPDNKTTLLVHEEEAAIVRLIFEKFLDIGTINGVVRYMGEREIRRPVRQTNRGGTTGGTRFSTTAIKKILTNRAYLAERAGDEGRIDCVWAPLLDRAVFNQAQEKLGKNNRNPPRGIRAVRDHVFLLEGRLKCGECGAAMTHASGGGRRRNYFYYACSHRAKTARRGCSTEQLPVEAIEGVVLAELRKLALDQDILANAVRRANDGQETGLEDVGEDIRRLRSRAADLRRQIGRLVEGVEASGDQPIAAIVRQLREREGQLAEVLASLDRAEHDRQVLERHTIDVVEAASSFANLAALINDALELSAREELKQFVQAAVERVVWTQTRGGRRKQGRADISLAVMPTGFWRLGAEDGAGLHRDSPRIRVSVNETLHGHTAGGGTQPAKPPRPARGTKPQEAVFLYDECRSALDQGFTRADLARKHGLSRARITQVMHFDKVHPAVLNHVRRGGCCPSVNWLRRTAKLPRAEQLKVARRDVAGFQG